MSQVKLILTESVHSLGEAGDLVSVKPGFARNFLLPQGKAILATETRVNELEHHKRIVAEKPAPARRASCSARSPPRRSPRSSPSRDTRSTAAASSCASRSRRSASTPCR